MPNVVIAGCGFAGSVMALRLLQLGMRVILLEVPRPDASGVEIIPASARHLLRELALDAVIASAKPGFGSGLLRRMGDGPPDYRFGRALHLERLALRRAVVAEAVARGAVIRRHKKLPPPDDRAFANVDATGRRAAWSRPLRRYGRARADIFETHERAGDPMACVFGLGSAWAYAVSDNARTTIGVIHQGELDRGHLKEVTREAFGLNANAPLAYLGRRPAFPQAADAPVNGRVIAIGDAAMSHDPIGGRGLSFALGSAFAAGAMLKTWRDQPERSEIAASYYRDYVAAERDRHLAFLRSDTVPDAAGALPPLIVWSGREAQAPVAYSSGIELSDVALTNAGACVRWLGQFDILRMQPLCVELRSTAAVLTDLCVQGLYPAEAELMVRWALRHGVLAPAAPRYQ